MFQLSNRNMMLQIGTMYMIKNFLVGTLREVSSNNIPRLSFQHVINIRNY